MVELADTRIWPRAKGAPAQTETERRLRVIEYFEANADAYAKWSPGHNMHFGYYRAGLDPLDRESLLEEMNHQVLSRLDLASDSQSETIDLGCGAGATARALCNANPLARVTGVGLIAPEIELAVRLAQAQRIASRATFLQMDYTRMTFPASHFDAAFALESSCYAAGDAKADFLRGARRVLRPGGRLVVADGFRKDDKPWTGLAGQCYARTCSSWCLDTFACIDSFASEMHQTGFSDIRIEEISAQVLPSALHIPFVTSSFVAARLAEGAMAPVRFQHALAPLLAMLVAISRERFGYFMVSGRK